MRIIKYIAVSIKLWLTLDFMPWVGRNKWYIIPLLLAFMFGSCYHLNMMSPLVLERGNDWENVPAGIKTRKMKNALYVQSEVPISQYDVPQAILLKQYLLPGLYPGRSARSIRREVFPYDGMIGSAGMFSTNAPRHEWEIVPVLPGEIYVCYTDLVFMAKNCT